MTVMAPRRIALFLSSLEAGGAQRQAILMASEWVRRGWRVSIITYEAPGTPVFFDIPDTVFVKRLNAARASGNAVSAAVANLARVRALRAALEELQPDVLLTFLAEMTVTGYMAATPLRIPVIACERTDPRVYPTGLWRTMRDLVYPRCARIVCQTRDAADHFAKTGKAIVIPNPVLMPAVDVAADIAAPARRFIAALGRLGAEKGHDVLIRAFATLAPLYPGVDLLIIGEGPQRAALERLVAAHDLGGRVYLPGAARQPFAALSRASLFVLPSRFEGFPNALGEAMALGLPVIATRFGGVEDIIRDGENGLIVPQDNDQALAQAMATLLQYPEQAAALGQAATRVTADFSLDRVMALWDRALTF